jgi:hypothetical protein
MAALDHMLRALDIMLKHGERRDAEAEADREAQAKAAQRAERTPRRQRSFSGPSLADDPSCCLAKRRVAPK